MKKQGPTKRTSPILIGKGPSCNNSCVCEPIGIFRSTPLKKYDLPRQPVEGGANPGTIVLFPGHNFEQALAGLEGFDRIWVVFWFNQAPGWKPKVLPPRGGEKQGVFATRSPHRPNPLGLSCVKLLCIKGRELKIEGHDLLDGTPVLDIKPYIVYADSFAEVKQGWLAEAAVKQKYTIKWSALAQKQALFLEQKAVLVLQKVFYCLEHFSGPSSSNRIKWIEEPLFELAYKSWRFICEKAEGAIHILRIQSGYDIATLQGQKDSQWSDVHLHRDFAEVFSLDKEGLSC